MAGWLLGTLVISVAYLTVRAQTRAAGRSSRLLAGEAQAWRRYRRQHESRPEDNAGLTAEQLRELQDQHLEAVRYVLATRNTIRQFSAAPDSSPTAEYDEGLREAGMRLHVAAMRFRGQLTDDDDQSRAVGATGEELSELRSVIARAMSAARNYGEVFH